MKNFSTCCLFILLTCLGCSAPKTVNLVETDGITTDFHRQHAGEILFSATPPAGKEYDSPEILTLAATDELYMTVLLENSLTNYLHELAPEATVEELDNNGNYQFTFIVDGNEIYTNQLNTGSSTVEQKHRLTRLDRSLVTYPFIDSWSSYAWMRFMLRGGGNAALTPGQHDFRLEIRPYINLEETVVGETIAAGNVILDIIPPSIENVNVDSIPLNELQPYNGLAVADKAPVARLIKELKAKVEARMYKDITSVVALKNGSILIEEYFNGRNRESTHDVRSVGKTFASTLLGMAIEDGHLESENQQLGAFYDLHDYENYDERKATTSLYDLMTMSSAFTGNDSDYDSPGNEENMYPTEDWVRFTLNLPAKKAGQRQWEYFTAGVVVLGDVIHQHVPGGLEAYAKQRLFDPLGITSQRWQQTPQGVANTAGGIQMTSLDFAKYGLLYANQGQWKGRQLLPEEWVNKSFSPQIAITDRPGENYGFLFWNKTFTVNGRKLATYYCAGNGGNKIFVFPEEDLVVVVTATAYNMPYAHPQVDDLMEKQVLPAVLERN